MESADLFSSLLNDPNAMQKISNLASEIMGHSAGTASDTPQDMPAEPVMPIRSVPSGMPEQEAFSQKLLPVLSSIANSRQKKSNPEKWQLLAALRPFLSSHTCAQIDHAEHILSMAQMAKAAASELISTPGQREV